MGKLTVQQTKERARAIVAENPGEIKYSALIERISNDSPETPKNTIVGSVWNLDSLYPNEITKPSRGLFKPIAKGPDKADEEIVVGETEQIAPSGKKVGESDFYEPFAEWLKNDLGEVTIVSTSRGRRYEIKMGYPRRCRRI